MAQAARIRLASDASAWDRNGGPVRGGVRADPAMGGFASGIGLLATVACMQRDCGDSDRQGIASPPYRGFFGRCEGRREKSEPRLAPQSPRSRNDWGICQGRTLGLPARELRLGYRFNADVEQPHNAAGVAVAEVAAMRAAFPGASGLITGTPRHRSGVSAQALTASLQGVSANEYHKSEWIPPKLRACFRS